MIQSKPSEQSTHNLIMENRSKLTVSGVTHTDSFDEQTLVLYTKMGELTVRGNGLHIDLLNIETGDAVVSGTIYGLLYTDERPKGSFWSKVFR